MGADDFGGFGERGGMRGSRLALSARWFHLVTMSFRALSQALNAWLYVWSSRVRGVSRAWGGRAPVEAGECVWDGGAFIARSDVAE